MKTNAELQDIAFSLNMAAKQGYQTTVDLRDGRLIVPAWGFELVLEISDSGGVEGYLNDTAD